MEIVTSWERRGIEKGRMEGRTEGVTQGRKEAFREMLLDVLVTRFGPLEESAVARVRALDSVDDLRRLTHVALTAGSLTEMGL